MTLLLHLPNKKGRHAVCPNSKLSTLNYFTVAVKIIRLGDFDLIEMAYL